jgi:hypothetical protein
VAADFCVEIGNWKSKIANLKIRAVARPVALLYREE